MKTSEIKARIASLIDIPIQDIILNKDKEGTSKIQRLPNGQLKITYSDEAALAHEFFHACFTNFENKPSLLLNALEDIRIDAIGRTYDKDLADLVVDDVNSSMEKVARETKDVNMRALKGLSIPLSCDPTPLIKDLEEPLKQAIIDARKIIARDTSRNGMMSAYQLLEEYFPNTNNKSGDERETIKNASGDMDEIRKGEEEEQKLGQGLPGEEDKRKLQRTKEKLFSKLPRQVMDLPDIATQTRIIKGITDIIQNKAIAKRQNSTEGKLNTKRIGRVPSQYIFTRKTAPSPKTKIYLLIDLSGSMQGAKTHTTVRILNTLRKIKSNDLKFEFRGFNSVYFKNDEIGFNTEQILKENMYPRDSLSRMEYAAHNDDGHFLRVIMKEIHQDQTDNKVLLILSDGEPTNSGKFNDSGKKGLKEAAKELEESEIKYASIGILTESVKEYYKKAVYVKGLEGFAKSLSTEIRRLIK